MIKYGSYYWLGDATEIWFKVDSQNEKDTVAVFAQKYQNNYFIKLQNTEYVSFKFSSIELGALSIPFKYRFSGTRNGKPLDSDFQADLRPSRYIKFNCCPKSCYSIF